MRGRCKGFTLVELLVVIIVLGILIAVAVGRYYSGVDAARDKARLADLKNIQMLIEVSYPRPAEDTWADYIYSQMDRKPVCPYSGEPYQLLTGVLDTSDRSNICKVAYRRIDDLRYLLTSYHFAAGYGNAYTVVIQEFHYQSGCSSEYVTIANVGDGAVDIGGWTLEDSKGAYHYVFTFASGTVLNPHTSITVYSRPKVQPVGSWNRGCTGGIWNDTGDEAVLRDSMGNVIDSQSY